MCHQLTIDDVGTRLRDATFVVVDLETTGGRPVDAGITEIGAVKIRGGEVIGEFATLVNPGLPIPAFIAALTGITDQLVANAPRLATVLPSFLEFSRGAVFIAHNAPYDIGFLKSACLKLGHDWPGNRVFDTARIARITLHRDEVPNCKLSTLAAYFRTEVTPTHRAFDDARATADVFHRLLERVGDHGVETIEDLVAFSSKVTNVQRTKRYLADGLPESPGVYIFKDHKGQSLYVGTSRNIRKRVRTYFTSAQTRPRISEMIKIADRVEAIACATPLEARVRELRLIGADQPRYNQKSKRPDRQFWLKLTAEASPRITIVRERRADAAEGAHYFGPFTSSSAAEAASAALQEAFPLRACTTKLARHPRSVIPGCALAELGKCLAPCTSKVDRTAYEVLVADARRAISGDVTTVVDAVMSLMSELSGQSRFEEAGLWRDRLSHFIHASVGGHQIAMLGSHKEIVAAKPTEAGGWEIHCIRFGSLAGAVIVEPGVDPRPSIDALITTSRHVDQPTLHIVAGLVEEAQELLAWLDSPQVRLVRTETGLALPIACGGALLALLGQVHQHVRLHTPAAGDYQSLTATARAQQSRPTGSKTPRGSERRSVTRITLDAAGIDPIRSADH